MSRANEPAFPQIKDERIYGAQGLTKRELFAAIFMAAGMIANALVNKQLGDWRTQGEDACDAADGLLAELTRNT